MNRFKSLIVNYIYVFIIIYSTDSFLTFANENPTPKIFFRIFLYVIMLYMFIKWNKKIVLDYEGYYLLTAVICVVMSMLINRDFSNGNITKVSVIIFGYLFVRQVAFEKFKKVFSDFMIIIAAFSVVTYIFRNFFLENTNFPMISNGGQKLMCLGLSNLFTAEIDGIVRNWGPFWEPGVFQAYLILALLFVLKDLYRPFWHKLVLVIALITTFSTTGYVCLAVLLLGFMMKGDLRKIDKKKLAILSAGIIVFVLVITNESLSEMVFGKFSTKSLSFESTRSRFTSISANIYVWMHNILFGVGLTKMSMYFSEYMESLNYVIYSNTNGLLMNFATYGVLWGIVYTLSFFKLAKKIEKNVISRIIFFMVFLFLMFAEPFLQSLLFNLIVFYGLHKEENGVEKNENIVVNKCNTRSSC